MRSPIPRHRSGLVLALVALAAWLALAQPALGGSYAVRACFGSEGPSWAEVEPSPFVTAYVACPGGVVDAERPGSGEGLVVRNVVGPGFAPRGASAALAFDAPAGTTITGLDFDAALLTNPGWQAGVRDAGDGAWLWCGGHCGTSAGLWVHKELRGLATRRVEALVRCAAARCSRTRRHGFVALRNVRVLLEDPSPPRLGGLRGALLGGAWLRGAQDVAFAASDDTGVALAQVELDGRAIATEHGVCDFLRRVPCPASLALRATFATRGWTDGAHALRLSAVDAAGNPAALTRSVRVDNTPPATPEPALAGGDAWSAARRRALALPLPGGQVSPLARALISVCARGGACVRASSAALASVPVDVPAGPGEYAVRVALADAAGNAGAFSAPLTLRFDDVRPGAPDLGAADAWHSGGAVAIAATGVAPPSGIRGFRVRLGARDAIVPGAIALDGIPEGQTPVQVSAISGAGVESDAVRTMLKVDRTAPVAAADATPSGWSRLPVTVALRAHDQLALSGVRSLAWSLDGGPEQSAAGDTVSVALTADGRHTLAYRAVDGAGNVSAPRSVAVAVDRTPPETVAFEATDPADPRRVSVIVSDRTSGIAAGTIELRPAGGSWRPLHTLLARDRLVAVVEDSTLRPGAYELRARAVDGAGNVALGTRRVDGAAAALRLPLRRRTRLTVRRAGALLHARLTAAGRPLGGREVALRERLRGRPGWRSLCPQRTVVIARNSCALRTDAGGAIDARIATGPSRTLRFVFAGDAQLLPAQAALVLRTRARARLTARPRVITAGTAVTFTGRLLGGHVPRGGKLVELQALVGAAWRTFATARAGRRGRLRAGHRFSSASRGRTYRFRLLVPREADYPFERGTSPPVSIHVR